MRALFFPFILLITSCEDKLFEEKNNDPEFIFDSFWHELDRNYSFFPYSNLNWDSVYSVYRPQITSQTTEADLFGVFNQMADLLHDAHTNIFTPIGIAGNIHYFDKYPVNQIVLNDSCFERLEVTRVFEYGKLKSANIGYVKIKTFDGESNNFLAFEEVLDTFKTTEGLIIDIRSNRGGYISNSEIIASRLADSVRSVCKSRVRNGPKHTDFSEWTNVTISPAKTGVHYSKPVIVLTNRLTFSASEWFVLFVRVIPKVTVVGDTTGGGSAQTLVRELPNGWILRTSNTQTLTTDGRDFQMTGLYPDIAVWISPQDSAKMTDTILEKAISLLKGNQ